MEKNNVTTNELVEIIKNMSEDFCNFLMDSAVEDANKLFEISATKSDVTLKIYKAYLVGYALSEKKNKEL